MLHTNAGNVSELFFVFAALMCGHSHQIAWLDKREPRPVRLAWRMGEYGSVVVWIAPILQ